MKVLLGIQTLSNEIKGSVLTIGNFDGVHLGHQALIKRVVEAGRKLKLPSIVVTFDPHPVQILYPEKGLKRLFTREDLETRLSHLGVDYLVVEAFSREFSELSPEKFIKQFIFTPFAPKKIFVGYDFNFGANRSGSAKDLAQLSLQYGAQSEIIDPISDDEGIISSSRIRKALALGDVQQAQRLLGRFYYVRGWVEKGEGRGRQLGFPTANLKLLSETLPQSGVYACRVQVKDKSFQAVTNIGVKPTFSSEWTSVPKLETYLIDQNINLYGETIDVEFHQFLRNEKKFSSVEELKTQIKLDVENTKKFFKG